MVKFYQSQTVYPFSWRNVACGLWLRYPNPQSTHVLTEDILTREIRDGNKLYTKRLITKTNNLPNWGRQFFSSKDRIVCVVEESLVDADTQTFTTRTRNIGFTTKILDVTETVVYRQDHSKQNWTLADRQATLASSFLGLTYALEQFGIRRFKKNCEKATNGFMHVLSSLYGVTDQKNIAASNEKGFRKVGTKFNEAKANLKKAQHLAKQKVVLLAGNDNSNK